MDSSILGGGGGTMKRLSWRAFVRVAETMAPPRGYFVVGSLAVPVHLSPDATVIATPVLWLITTSIRSTTAETHSGGTVAMPSRRERRPFPHARNPAIALGS